MRRQRILPLADWPAADRALWHRLIAAAGPLDDPGALSALRESSRTTIRNGYGRWLAWLSDAAPAVLEADPAGRATPERLSAWMAAMADHAPMSRLMVLSATLRVLTAAAPGADWRGARRLETVARRAASRDHGSRKTGRILSSDVLVAAGLRLAVAGVEVASTPLKAAQARRDGVMLATLALMPMRARTFAELALGRSVRVGAQAIRIAAPAQAIKTGNPWEASVPDCVAPLLRQYIDTDRPWLMARFGTAHDRLWVGDRGQPYPEGHLGQRIRDITERLTGVQVTPQFFRDAAATTLARTSPDAARLTRGLLGHARFETATRHYNQARAIEAGRDYAGVLSRLAEETDP